MRLRDTTTDRQFMSIAAATQWARGCRVITKVILPGGANRTDTHISLVQKQGTTSVPFEVQITHSHPKVYEGKAHITKSVWPNLVAALERYAKEIDLRSDVA